MRYARAFGGLVSVGLWAALALGADQSPKRPSFEAELIFERIDLSGDGAIDRAEFLQFSDYSPGLRGKPEAAKQAFDRLDQNHNDLVSLQEYLPAAQRQIAFAAAAAGGKPAAAPAPAAERPVAEGPITPEQLTFFEAKIRPVLIENCYKCHAAPPTRSRRTSSSTPARASAKGATWAPRSCRATPRRAC